MTDDAVNSYSTGGGGVRLEQLFGATMLAALRTDAPTPLLGEGLSVVDVWFQASPVSQLDDLVIHGVSDDGVARHVAVAVRRDPTIAAGDAKFVAIVKKCLKTIATSWPDIWSGTLRLGLVVAAPHGPADTTQELSGIARAIPDPAAFRQDVMTPGRHNSNVRQRLTHLEGAVAKASGSDDEGTNQLLTWKLLFGLWVQSVQLQGEIAPGRTACIGELQHIVDSPSEAVSLFGVLCDLAGDYGPAGARVDVAKLGRDLLGRARVKGAIRYAAAWEKLTALEERGRRRIGRSLEADGVTLTIDRAALRSALVERLRHEGGSTALLVTGDPDVGKSSLVLDAMEDLGAENGVSYLVNLRDLPRHIVDLEDHLGVALSVLFAAGAVDQNRTVVVDGAEAVLEGWSDVFAELERAAREAGLQTVAVARADAAPAVTTALRAGRVDVFEVPPFDDADRQSVASNFPALARFAEDERSTWLLGRPGLIDLVLKSDVAASLPEGPLCEADIFHAVWSGRVRNHETHLPGEPGPDAREHVLVTLADSQLTGSVPSFSTFDAHSGLRSDGLIIRGGPWAPGDEFASDLVRDFALARLLLQHGFQVLVEAGAPRWAVRAVILALQSRLLQAGQEVAGERRRLLDVFEPIAASHGRRWIDLIAEAVLTLSRSAEVLEAIWADLVDGDADGLKHMLRIVDQRFSQAQVAEPVIVGPVLEVALALDSPLATLPGAAREALVETILAFLRGLVVGRPAQGVPLRTAVRKVLLAMPESDKKVQGIALLGSDLDESTKDYLQDLARQAPHRLDAVVEWTIPDRALADVDPGLLLELSEAYYIEDGGRGITTSPMDWGIRRHTASGPGFPFADRFFGPFWLLLQARPRDAVALVNRMLDHAAGIEDRVEGRTPLGIELPGYGTRAVAGGGRLWPWYRGSFGPGPCTSALLALEEHLDRWHQATVTITEILSIVLEGCHNTAMVALVVGFLTRHLDEVGTELDLFLTQPLIWELEANRMVHELGLVRAHRDNTEIHGYEYRKLPFANIATILVARALEAEDTARCAELERVADRFVARTTDGQGRIDPTHRLWAGTLRASTYEVIQTKDGRMAYTSQPPDDLVDEVAARRDSAQRDNEGMRLLNTYARDIDRRVVSVNAIEDDLKIAQQLESEGGGRLGFLGLKAAAACAASALIAHGGDQVVLSRDDVLWAAGAMITVAMASNPETEAYPNSTDPMGLDRSAAAALPHLLMPAYHESASQIAFDAEDVTAICDAMSHLSHSPSDEVRTVQGRACAVLWSAPCCDFAAHTCRHVLALDAIEESLRDCRFGPSENYQRSVVHVEGDLVASRVNHCDLRGTKGTAFIGPAERRCFAVVVLDERDDAPGELVDRVELASTKEPTLQDREEQLDLVQP